jgi:ribosomal protein S18 acetylase RimI-like enzyme
MVTLQPISPGNVLVFKTVRLRALQDAPTAFGSTYAKESRLVDDEWLQRSLRWTADGSVGYLAFEADACCGLVACYTEQDNPSRGHIVSMWVDAAFRRAGVGKMLIDALTFWAADRGLRDLKLMVTSVNEGAIRFYQRLGFRMTGLTGPYPNDPSIFEYEMVLSLET